jgi:hypothetical protein
MATIYAMILGDARNTTAGTPGYRPEGYWVDAFTEEYGDDCLWGPTVMQSVLILKVINFPFEVDEIRSQLRTRNADDGTEHHRFVTDIPHFRGTFTSPTNAAINRQLAKGVETRKPEDMVEVDWPTHLALDTVDNGGPVVELFDGVDDDGNGISFDPPQYEQELPVVVA